MHIVVPRGPHTHEDVTNALKSDAMAQDFSIVQWWPITLVTCDLHGSECQAPHAHREVQNVLHGHGIPSKVMQTPAIRCDCGD